MTLELFVTMLIVICVTLLGLYISAKFLGKRGVNGLMQGLFSGMTATYCGLFSWLAVRAIYHGEVAECIVWYFVVVVIITMPWYTSIGKSDSEV
jgi:hypothetical protein